MEGKTGAVRNISLPPLEGQLLLFLKYLTSILLYTKCEEHNGTLFRDVVVGFVSDL